MAAMIGKLKNIFQKEGAASVPNDTPSLSERIFGESDSSNSLTRHQRFIGCGISFVMGVAFTWLSMLFFITSIHTFAVFYTLGNVFLLSATFFLVGPAKQFKNMMKKGRIFSSLTYLAALIGTLVAAFALSGFTGFLVVVCCLILQLLAMTWYCLSYLPFGQSMMKRALGWEAEGP